MKKILKKAFAVAMAFALVATGVATVDTTSEAATSYVETAITSISYNLTASDGETAYLFITTDSTDMCIEVTSGTTADYSFDIESVEYIKNLGYVAASDNWASLTESTATVTVNSITLNGEYTFSDDGSRINRTIGYGNDAIWNMWWNWNDDIYTSDESAYLSCTSSGAFLYVATEDEDETPEEEEEAAVLGTAYINAADANWSINAWSGNQYVYSSEVGYNIVGSTYEGTEITSDGTWLVVLNLDEITLNDWDVGALNTDLQIEIRTETLDLDDLTFSDFVVYIDGVAVTVDQDAVVITQDEDGIILIELLTTSYDEANNWAAYISTNALGDLTIVPSESIVISFYLSGTGVDEPEDGTGSTVENPSGDTSGGSSSSGSSSSGSSSSGSSSSDSSSSSGSSSDSSSSSGSSSDSGSSSSSATSNGNTSDDDTTAAQTGEVSTCIIFVVFVIAVAGVAFTFKKAR